MVGSLHGSNITCLFLAAHTSSSKKETVLFIGLQSVVLAVLWSCFRYAGRPGHLKATVSPAESLVLLMFSVLFVGVLLGGYTVIREKVSSFPSRYKLCALV